MFILAHWTNNLSPFLIQFGENFGIRYYGLAYMLGFIGAGWLLHLYTKANRSKLADELIVDFMTAMIMGVMLGGRLGYFLLYEPASLLQDPLLFFKVWKGGMASHGGFIGVALALAWFARTRRIPFLHLSDLIASTTALGLMLGRLANFINGELWGKPASVWWAVNFPASPWPMVPRHPSQLYEAALEGLLLLVFAQWRFWRTDVIATHPGRLAGEFLIVYAIVRAFCETFREPDAGLILGLSRGTFYSLFLVAIGVGYILVKPLIGNRRK
jgi:phosphatidylglycerol---prolipoprotein diacylglyceryl transferase|uniref:prolipoprotein diacylglyceryl transferase n=2 Tax=Cephaloticoccus sp. TaxID=1985742 RepID=UPI00404B2A1A